MVSQTINPLFGQKHKEYIRDAGRATIAVAEGAVRAGKTIDNIFLFSKWLNDGTPDKFHLATGSTSANAKLNIAVCNGYGLEYIFRGRCRWTKYRGNEALAIKIRGHEYIVIFAGAAKADSFKKIRGNSYGMWIATEVNLHHESMIQEAFSRQLAAKNRRVYWDLNPSAPGSWIYERYIDRFPEQFGDRYHYEHFTIRDNITISEERLKEIESQYEPGSVWYRRDILGERSIAEGLVYVKLAMDIAEGGKKFGLKKEGAVQMARQKAFLQITAGVDFGGNGSGHAFVAVGITEGFEHLIVLRSERYIEGKPDPEGEERMNDIDPETLGRLFLRFIERVESDYGHVSKVYADSAEQVLIRGLRTALTRAAKDGVKILNAKKTQINNRIFAATSLAAQDRLKFVVGDCKSWEGAVSTAVWNPKKIDMERLDDGTSDIDTLDAFEYTFEREIPRFLRVGDAKEQGVAYRR